MQRAFHGPRWTKEAAMTNPFTYCELHSKDAKKARVHAWDVRPGQKKDSVLARHEKVGKGTNQSDAPYNRGRRIRESVEPLP